VFRRQLKTPKTPRFNGTGNNDQRSFVFHFPFSSQIIFGLFSKHFTSINHKYTVRKWRGNIGLHVWQILLVKANVGVLTGYTNLCCDCHHSPLVMTYCGVLCIVFFIYSPILFIHKHNIVLPPMHMLSDSLSILRSADAYQSVCEVFTGWFLKENPVLETFRQNSPSPLIHDVINVPNTNGLSLKNHSV
jgi:hypothetical protein